MPEDLNFWLTKGDEKFRVDDESQNGIHTEAEPGCTMFRVPAQLLELSEQSYKPKFFNLGLYGHNKETVSFTLAYRHDFAKHFMKICNLGTWSDICKQVVGKTNDSIRALVKLYDDFKVEDFKDDEFKLGSTTLDQANRQSLGGVAHETGDQDAQLVNGARYQSSPTLGKICLTLTMDAVFVVCFIIANHHKGCGICIDKRGVNNDLNAVIEDLVEVVKREALCNLLHLVRLDMLKFENQIPLPLIIKVVEMMPEITFRWAGHNPAPRTDGEQVSHPIDPDNEIVQEDTSRGPGHNSAPKTDGKQLPHRKDPLNEIVQDFINLTYCNLPGFADRHDFLGVVKSIQFRECRHLLHCLYLVITYKSKREENGNASSGESNAAQGDGTSTTPCNFVSSFLACARKFLLKGPEYLSKGTGRAPPPSDDQARNTAAVADAVAQGSTAPLNLTSSSAPGSSIGGAPPPSEIGPEGSDVQSVRGQGSNTGERTNAVSQELTPASTETGQDSVPRSDGQSVHDQARNTAAVADAVAQGSTAPLNLTSSSAPGSSIGGAPLPSEIGPEGSDVQSVRGQGSNTGERTNAASQEQTPASTETGQDSVPASSSPAVQEEGHRRCALWRYLFMVKNFVTSFLAWAWNFTEGENNSSDLSEGNTGASAEAGEPESTAGLLPTSSRAHGSSTGAAPSANVAASSSPAEEQDHPKRASRWCIFKGSQQDTHEHHKYQIPTVSQLRKAGIRVKVGENNSTKGISDVKFDSRTCTYKGTLYLPAFDVYDETESLLRNLVTYEYVVEKKEELLSYVHLMGNLISTEEDVELLMDSEVLKNNTTGSSKHLAEMWATMLIGVAFELTDDYKEVFDKTWKHYKTKRNQRFEEFFQTYCRRFWLLGGLILLGITLAATILGVTFNLKNFYKNHKS